MAGSPWSDAWQQVSNQGPAAAAPAEPMNVDTRGINEALLTNPQQEIATFDAAKAKKQAAATKTQETQALEQQIQATANNPWTKLGNALTSQYQQEMTPIAPLVSGQGGSQAEVGAADQALASLGLSSGSAPGQWLASQTAAAQQTAAPVAQAMNQEAAQMQSSMNPISAALANYAQANAQLVETAPESGWLNALASHITSNLSYQGVIPTAAEGSLTPSLLEALQRSGGYGGSGAGTVPLQSLTVQKGKVAAAPTGSASITPYGTPGLPVGSTAPGG
jgi:hypothetical protein